MANTYYIYLHLKLDTGIPFYIGKGTLRRAYKKTCRSDFWNNVNNKHGFDVLILEDNLNEKEAFERESYWINRIGRKDLNKGNLINQTNGGEGASGHIQTEVSKLKKSLSLKGRKLGKYSEDRIKNASKPRSEQAKINIKNGIISRIKVNQYTKEGTFIKTYNCIAEAKKATGATHINHCVYNKPMYKTSGGFIWKLAKEGGNLA